MSTSVSTQGQSKILFLGGMGRSGTTLLERLLGELPGVCAIGETAYLWHRGVRDNEQCGCGNAFHDCPFWNTVGDIAFGGWDALNVQRVLELQATIDRIWRVPVLSLPHPPRHVHAHMQEYALYYTRLYEGVRKASGCSLIVDSSKFAALAFALRRAPGIDLRVVRMIRDSRGVAYSWSKKTRRPEGAGDTAFMPQIAGAKVASLWLMQNIAFSLLSRLGVRTRTLHYDDLVTKPKQHLRGLARFAGIEVAKKDLSFLTATTASMGRVHTVSGNPVRFTTGTIELFKDENWRQAMSKKDQALVSVITLPLLYRYGYIRARLRGQSRRRACG